MCLLRTPGAVALLASVLWPVVAMLHAQEGSRGDREMERLEVRALEIRGVESVDADDIRNSIATEASSCANVLYRFTACLFTKSSVVYNRAYLDRDELARDVLRIRVFYWRRGFREAAVDTLVRRVDDDDAVAVTFEVTEGEPTVVDTVVLTGVDTLLTDDQISRLVEVRQGEPLSLIALDSSLFLLRNALWDLGYADAQLDTTVVVDSAAHRARVAIAVEPRWIARVGTLTIRGVESLAERTVRNSLLLREGDVFRRSELLRSQQSLYESGLFRRATLAAEGEDSVKAVVVTVNEGDIRQAQLGAGFNTIDFVQVDAGFTHHNLFGGARRLQMQAAVGNLLAPALEDQFIFREPQFPEGFDGERSLFLRPNWQASIELQQRWFRSPLNTISISAFAHRRSTPAVVIERGQGGNASFTREVLPRINLSTSYRFEITRVEAGDVYFCVNFGVCDPPTIGALTSAQRLSPALLLGTANRSDSPLAPTRGFTGRVEIEHASGYTGSDFRYNRALGEGTTYRGVGPGVLAGRVRVGWVGALESAGEALGLGGFVDGNAAVLHPRKRFYSGGSRSVRGFGENQLGPRVLTIAPNALRGLRVEDGDTTYSCAPTQPIATCSLNGVDALRDQDFNPRPVGGSSVLEGSIEYRFPVWGPLTGAAFIDGAVLTPGDGGPVALETSFLAVTPGFGVRYVSPVGPIRVDIGYNPMRSESLPVLTQTDENGSRQIVQVRGAGPADDPELRQYEPFGTGFSLSRLTLHLSIGEAF